MLRGVVILSGVRAPLPFPRFSRARNAVEGPLFDVTVPSLLLLNAGEHRWYNDVMRAMGLLNRKVLPRAIPAMELQNFLEASAAFCSWDPSRSIARELTAGWPYLFSHPCSLAADARA